MTLCPAARRAWELFAVHQGGVQGTIHVLCTPSPTQADVPLGCAHGSELEPELSRPRHKVLSGCRNGGTAEMGNLGSWVQIHPSSDQVPRSAEHSQLG